MFILIDFKKDIVPTNWQVSSYANQWAPWGCIVDYELEEQDKIATVFEEVDLEIGKLEHRLRKARAIKEGMMQELLTGRTRLPAEAV